MTAHLLFQQPELWERCGRDRAFCALAVEEGLRHSSPSSPPRIALEDIDYAGVHIPRGTHLMFLLNISGRDPRSFDDPMAYRPGRAYARHHLAFGKGAHICLGLHLARFQMEEGLHLIAQRIRNPQIIGEVTWRRFPGVWGLESLPIRFTLG
ncbi:MAG: cytochrome P450 [Novosphingobium sp.]|nr:cytochrome P450 [Novosphingobium sp.]